MPDIYDRYAYKRYLYYYLAGSVLVEGDPTFARIERSDFVLSRRRDYGGEGFSLTTPENREIFLHAVELAPLDFYRAERRRVESAEPVARFDFDLYIEDDSLYYVKDPCAEYDARGRFFLNVHPFDDADLPENRRAIGHASLNFDFAQRGTPVFDGACMAKAPLPDYAITVIETGQWIPGGEEIWRAAINPPLSAKSAARYESLYQAAKASGEPIIRSDFDVYMEGDALTYLKEPCAESDTLGRFFLSVHPVSAADIPESRREIGHDALNFDFAPHGIIVNGKCMIRRELPDYPISKIETGQWIPGVDTLWSGAANMRD